MTNTQDPAETTDPSLPPSGRNSSEHWNIDSAAMLTLSAMRDYAKDLSDAELRRLTHDWDFLSRLDQRAPKGDWRSWVIMGGRGAGKTRAGAEWIRTRIKEGAERIALVAETYADAREVMLDGPSGLLHIGREDERPRFEPSRRRVTWGSGAVAQLFSAEDPEGLRGYQFDTAWSDELAKWSYDEETWSNLQFGLRLGDDPRQVVTTTPRPVPLLRQLLGRKTTVTTNAPSSENRANLADSFFDEIAAVYEGTALGRQELLGELIEEVAGALWTRELIERSRAQSPEDFSRIVVAVDPPVTSGSAADACGIVVAGLGTDGEAYILDDRTVSGLSPSGWAQRVAGAYRYYGADRVVAEVNQGGELVAAMLRLEDASLPIRQVRATRGKLLRAEPVAALYEQGRVHHTRPFPELEDQMCAYTGAPSQKSPDRFDALVWALTELMLTKRASPRLRTL
jgi:phage terminase large subunit-like protein